MDNFDGIKYNLIKYNDINLNITKLINKSINLNVVKCIKM